MLLAFFRNLFRQRRTEEELDDELRSYLELTTAENIRRGMAPEAATAEARSDLGGMEQVKENVRDVRAGVSLEIFLQDVRYAIRGLRKNPAFAAIATLTLALGAGASTTIFSIVNGVLLKPLPYPSPDRLVTLWESHPKFGRFLTVAPANFYDWRAQSNSLDRLTALDPYPDFILTGGSQPYRLTGAAVTADFFPLFGIRMTLGRGFQAAEDHAVVLSYAAWQQYFGGRLDIASRQVRLNGESYTVVGVLPRDFYLVAKSSDFQSRKHFDVLTNLGLTAPPEEWQRQTHPLFAFGRLKPGVQLDQARADLARIALTLARLYPSADQDHTIDVVPMADNAVGGVRTALLTLLAGVGMVLLIACANIANLLLTRATARQKEMALRAALGASRKRLARQLLTESGVLAAIGSAMGLALALSAVPWLAAHLPADLPRTSEIAVDRRVLAFTSSIAVATGILFGLAPLSFPGGVRINSRGVASGQSRLRSALIVGQVSLAVVLLAGAGLMTKSLRALLQVSPGFRTDHILTARFSLPPRYANAWKFGIGLRRELSAFQRVLADRVRAIPGVQSAAFVSYLPLAGADNNWAFFIEGRPPKPPGEFDSADYRPVTAGYFETMGIPVIRGRSFTPQDDEDHPLAVAISESMARKFWPGEDALGKRLKFGSDDWRTIVGIAGDVHHQALSSLPQPEMYVPWGQVPNVEIRPTMVLRSFVDPASLANTLRRVAAAVDPEVPMDQTATMDQLVSDSAAESRFRAVFLSAFALLALFVSSIGLYGVMSHLVSQRTREFGIRMAVGATRGSVLAFVLKQGVKLAGIGVAIGLVAAAALGRLIASLLFGVEPLDAVTLAGVSILLAALALLASYIPARRAANADPMESLRYE
jgi:putative ABC transport system permease protein